MTKKKPANRNEKEAEWFIKRRGEKRFIAKVQLSIGGNSPERRVMIYGEGKEPFWTGPASKEIVELMGDCAKNFFWGWLRNDGKIIIEEEAHWQEW